MYSHVTTYTCKSDLATTSLRNGNCGLVYLIRQTNLIMLVDQSHIWMSIWTSREVWEPSVTKTKRTKPWYSMVILHTHPKLQQILLLTFGTCMAFKRMRNIHQKCYLHIFTVRCQPQLSARISKLRITTTSWIGTTFCLQQISLNMHMCSH